MIFIKNNEKIALVQGSEQLSYRSLLAQVESYAKLVGNVEKVAIFSENRFAWMTAFLGAWKAGAICVPIDFMAVAAEVSYILNDCQPEVIFYSQETEAVIRNAVAEVNYSPKLISLEEIGKESSTTAVADFEIADLHKVSSIIYTSGTTGSPKGVMLTYDNILANAEAVRDVGYYSKDMTVLVLLPLHHIFPLLGSFLAVVFVGGTCAFTPSMAAEDIMATLQKNKVTLMIGVPRFYDLLLRGIKAKIDKSFVAKKLFFIAQKLKSKAFSQRIFKAVHEKFGGHIQYLICGGAKLDLATGQGYQALGFDICEGYGMSEAAPMITFPRPGKVKIGSAGQVLSKDSVKIADGEILARGRNIMKGYYHRDDETAQVMQDGWLSTGDVGCFDEEGYLFITGRKKEIIVLPNGKNINPVEIEAKISGISSAVHEIGVFLKNDTLQALIVPEPKAVKEQREHDLQEFFLWQVIDRYNKLVSPYKRILKFTLTNTPLPRTRLQKLQRFKLEEFVADSVHEKSHQPEPELESYRLLKRFVQEHTKNEIYPDDHLEIDLGLDSLAQVMLQGFLADTFGVKITDTELLEYPTLAKLAGFIEQKKTKIAEQQSNWSEILEKGADLTLPADSFSLPLLKNIGSSICRGYFNISSTGVEQIPDGPCILAPNHQTFLDGMFVMQFLNSSLFRKTYFFAKEKHFAAGWKRYMANRNNIIVMGFDDDLVVSLQKMAEVLKQGKNLIIFPEGTRTRDGKVGKFKNIFAILSVELDIPIIPVSISGAFAALPRDSVMPKAGTKISVHYLPLVSPAGHSYTSLAETVKSHIVSKIKI